MNWQDLIYVLVIIIIFIVGFLLGGVWEVLKLGNQMQELDVVFCPNDDFLRWMVITSGNTIMENIQELVSNQTNFTRNLVDD